MNIKQQLEQVIAEMRDYARQAWSPEVEEWVPRLSAIVEVMDKVEPVAWMFSRAYGNGLSFARPDDYEDEDGSLVTPTPLYAAPQVPDGMVLVSPEGEVIGPCVCGGWPGGKCLRCKVVSNAQVTGLSVSEGPVD